MLKRVEHFFDTEYITNLFKRKLPEFYPDFPQVKDFIIYHHKKNIGEKSYHLVLEYRLTLMSFEGQTREVSVFCAAHSSEPREHFFFALKFLWQHGFRDSELTIPRPLFFSTYLNGVFYEGAEGNNLHHYIFQQNKTEIEKIIRQTAKWFAKLHTLAMSPKEISFPSGFMAEVVPGLAKVYSEINRKHPHYLPLYHRLYDELLKREQSFRDNPKDLCLIHGDAHPDNIIKTSQDRIAVIDLNDLSWGDPARDLGCFLEQLEYMTGREGLEIEYTEFLKQLFLDEYFSVAKIKLNDELKARIDNYYNWTALRTATFFILKEKPEPARAHGLLVNICRNLKIETIV